MIIIEKKIFFYIYISIIDVSKRENKIHLLNNNNNISSFICILLRLKEKKY